MTPTCGNMSDMSNKQKSLNVILKYSRKVRL